MHSSSTQPLARLRTTSTFEALRDPAFRRLWPAGWLYYSGHWMEMITLQWLVLQMTDSPAQVALVGVGRMAPMFFLGLVAGSIADRFPKQRVILAGQAATLVVTSIMLALVATDTIEAWHVYPAIVITGTAKVIDFAARRSYLSELFEGRRLTNAVALDSVASMGIGSMLGPLLSGGMIALYGYTGAYVVIVGATIGATLLVLTIQRTGSAASTVSSDQSGSQVTEAFRFLRGNRALWAVLAVTVVHNFFGMPYQQMVPVIARDSLGVGSALYGLLASTSGLGALTGTLLIAGHAVRRQGTAYSLGATMILVFVFLFSFSPFYLLSIVLLFAAGLSNAGFVVMQPLLVLQAVPKTLRGRAMGALALSIGVGPMGVLVIGFLAEGYGATTAVAIMAGTGFLLVNLLRLSFPSLRA